MCTISKATTVKTALDTNTCTRYVNKLNSMCSLYYLGSFSARGYLHCRGVNGTIERHFPWFEIRHRKKDFFPQKIINETSKRSMLNKLLLHRSQPDCTTHFHLKRKLRSIACLLKNARTIRAFWFFCCWHAIQPVFLPPRSHWGGNLDQE